MSSVPSMEAEPAPVMGDYPGAAANGQGKEGRPWWQIGLMIVLVLILINTLYSYYLADPQPVDTPNGGVAHPDDGSAIKAVAPGETVETEVSSDLTQVTQPVSGGVVAAPVSGDNVTVGKPVIVAPPRTGGGVVFIPPTPAVITVPKTASILVRRTNKQIAPVGRDDNTFQIGELQAFVGSKALTKVDYSAAKFVDTPSYGSYTPNRAIDGNLRTFAHTGGRGLVHQMRFDLKVPQVLSKIVFHGRQDCCWAKLANTEIVLIDEKGNEFHKEQLRTVKGAQEFGL